MSKFTLEEIDKVKGKQKFYKLVRNGICEFDTFENKVTKNFETELKRIYLIMNRCARLESLPETQFKDITPYRDEVKEYEFKTHNLRVYAIHDKISGKIIVTGGIKSKQKQDINHFRNCKKEYLTEKELYDKERFN